MISMTAPELERRMRMSPIEFLSSLGGLFGLCLGFSIISLVELLYWIVLRSPILHLGVTLSIYSMCCRLPRSSV